HPHQALAARLHRYDVLAACEDDAADRNHVLFFDDVADNGESVLPHFAVGRYVVRSDVIEFVDFGLRHEFVDLDRPGALEGDRFELVVVNLDILALGDLIALDDVFGFNFFTGVLVDPAIADAIAGLFIDLVETDLLALAGGGEKLDRAGHEGKTQKALPIGARGHEQLLLKLERRNQV